MQIVEHQDRVEGCRSQIGRRIGFEIDDRRIELQVQPSAVSRRNAIASGLRSIACTSNPALAINNA